MHLIECAIGLLLLIAAWTALRLSALDRARDSLFDLRDAVRAHFMHATGGLDTPMYRILRDHLNSYIRFTERVHFTGLLLFVTRMPNHLTHEIATQLDAKFHCADPTHSQFVHGIRARATEPLQIYMVCTSITAVLFLTFGGLFLAFKCCHGGLKTAFMSSRVFLRQVVNQDRFIRSRNIEIAAFRDWADQRALT